METILQKRGLSLAGSASLDVRQRQRYLGERLEEARKAYARDEQAWGRQAIKEA